ncbi:MAG TPA: DUF4234 domain-containing protein [Candidatus Saccharimonadales bacterium]
MTNRVIWKMFILSIVTLGIYRLYWFVKTRREMMDLNPSVKILSPLFLIIPVVIVVIAIAVFVVTIVSSSGSGVTCNTATSAYGNNCTTSAGQALGIAALYLGIFIAYIFFVVWEWSYSHGVEAVTGGKLSFAMSLVVLILVPDGIDILIIQDSFNKLGAAPMGPAQTPGQMPPAQPPAGTYTMPSQPPAPHTPIANQFPAPPEHHHGGDQNHPHEPVA